MMKAFIVAIYTEFEGRVVGGKMPRQIDAFMGIPEGNQVFMKFHKVN